MIIIYIRCHDVKNVNDNHYRSHGEMGPHRPKARLPTSRGIFFNSRLFATKLLVSTGEGLGAIGDDMRSMFPEDSIQYHAQILDHGPLRSSMYKGPKDLYNLCKISCKGISCCQLRVHGAVH